MIKKNLYLAVLILILTACNQSGKFTISGTLSDAEGEMLYFEKNGLLKDSLIDSVKLSKTGQFKFKVKSPQYPDFYKLKLNEQWLTLGVDSIETIEIEGSGKNMIDAVITGSSQSVQIQKLRKSVQVLQKDFEQISKIQDDAQKVVMRDTFLTHLDFHRREVFDMILNNPLSLASYFALYQQISGSFIFSPYVKEDLNYYRAIATSMQFNMPDYDRTKNLLNLVVAAIKEERDARKQLDLSKIDVKEISGFVDIELKDRHGYPQKLSAQRGKPILLDFSAYAMEGNVAYTFELREIYNQYASKGLQIYQISLDENKMFWLHSVSNIPWITVIDESGRIAQLYNVQKIPTIYLIDKEGTIVGKYTDMKSVKENLSKII